jgi:hypothetical protein
VATRATEEAVREGFEMKFGSTSWTVRRTGAQLEQSGVLVVGLIPVSHARHDPPSSR